MRPSPKPKTEEEFLSGAKAEAPKKPAARKPPVKKAAAKKPVAKAPKKSEPTQKARVTSGGAYFAMNLQLTEDLRVDLDLALEKGYTHHSRQQLVREALREKLNEVIKKGKAREEILNKHGLG